MKVGSESRDRAEIVEREEGEKRVTKMTKAGTAKTQRGAGDVRSQDSDRSDRMKSTVTEEKG